ncbi:MAG: ferrous iron transport protein B [Clostridiales bacterium]|jgi:ferrous iron transport protein B|nr:ferrous iron transport protein B [Clostridiales bacterium]
MPFNEYLVMLAGNPNVGKSTIFNNLTGLKQHTGNWAGKTVAVAQGSYVFNDIKYIITDVPGSYSLTARSAEEETARDFICFGGARAVLVVSDATCLERNLNLTLQIMEITPNVILVVNLMDEAEKKSIRLDLENLSDLLGIPVVASKASADVGTGDIMEAVEKICVEGNHRKTFTVRYPESLEHAVTRVETRLYELHKGELPWNRRWAALKLLVCETRISSRIINYLSERFDTADLTATAEACRRNLPKNTLEDGVVVSLVKAAEEICVSVVSSRKSDVITQERRIDRILTGKWTGAPIMLILLAFVLWLTISGANYPSRLLGDLLLELETPLNAVFVWLPERVRVLLIDGGYRVMAWVVSVMLPPMAIFFPLFTLLEDLGYLPRVAFNLDHYFKKCAACGKQALTVCMGFGCNAAAVTGCRIIDSPRERLIAIITNSFVPCNGRFPTIIAIIAMFFTSSSLTGSILGVILMTGLIMFSITLSFAASRLLSSTILKGYPSSFTLELPPFRKPRIGQVIVRSILDRTLYVLGRAVVVAIPAGIIISVLANITISGQSLLSVCSNALDPFARLIGLDGVILLSFILGSPANEIVVPIMTMAYLAESRIMEVESIFHLRDLFVSHGWTWVTALCVMVFSLMHWPCSTTCLTISKETGGNKWMLAAFIIPTVFGTLSCFLIASTVRLFSLI